MLVCEIVTQNDAFVMWKDVVVKVQRSSMKLANLSPHTICDSQSNINTLALPGSLLSYNVWAPDPTGQKSLGWQRSLRT